MSVAIRPAGPQEAERLSILADRLFVQTFAEDFAIPYPADDLGAYLQASNGPAALASRLADPTAAAWVAEAEGVPVGYAMARAARLPHRDVRPEHGMLSRLYVERALRGSGLAVRLMDLALDFLGRRYGPRPWLSVYSGNLRAQRFYARYGFEACGEYDDMVGRWPDREFIMRRRLSS